MFANNTTKILGCVFALLCLFHTRAHAEQGKRMILKVGEQVSISANKVEKYSEGKKGIVDIRLPDDGKEFIVVGLRPGLTTLLLIRDGGKKFTYTFEVKAQTNEVPRSENIRLDFYFVELTEGGQFQVGVAWPGSIGVESDMELNIDSGGIAGGTASLSGLPLPRLDLLHRGDWARIARQASVITSNGEAAEFNSGGDVNIAVAGSQAAELRSIAFGTKVRVLPRFDADSGRLELRVDAEVSSLGEGQVPSRSRTGISTVVNIEMNQAIVLAGLHAKSSSNNRSGLPFLSQIPVLGALFGSHGQRQEHVQNVIFIVPSIVDIVDMDARAQIRNALQAYERFDGALDRVKLAPAVQARSAGGQ